MVPYSDANSVDDTNKDAQTYDTASSWVEHNCDDMIADLEDADTCRFRLVSEGGAKSKISEVNIDAVYTTYKVDGISYDDDKVALGSCICDLLKDNGDDTLTWKARLTSHATTGVVSFTGQGSGTYYIRYFQGRHAGCHGHIPRYNCC